MAWQLASVGVWAVRALALLMVGFHFFVVVDGPPGVYSFRGLHLLFGLVLVFMLYRSGSGWIALILDGILLSASVLAIGYVIVNEDALNMRFQLIAPLTTAQMVFGIVATLLVLEGARRTTGWALPITAAVFIVYGLSAAGMSPGYLIDVLYLTSDGIFGIPLAVSATYLFLFILFGALAEKMGTGQFFIDLAMASAGRTAGGAAKVASISSAFFGSISGSAVANIMTTGAFTIPMMKRTGYRPAFAGSVEAVASTGGQIMPPVMGAAAFVMAEFMGVPYLTVVTIALIPALLFFVSVFCAIHFEARRQGLRGLDPAMLPALSTVLRERVHQFLPLLVIIGTLLYGFSAAYAAFLAILSLIPVAALRRTTRPAVRIANIMAAVETGTRHALQVIMACAAAGIIIGIVAYSGAGIEFTSMVRSVSRDSLILALVMTALGGIVLGMGLPTTPAYIVQTALLVPTLIQMGVIEPAAHLFVLYFAIISVITPPVAIGLFAANSLSGATLWASSLAAIKLAATGYIVPFMFVFGPGLLMIGTWWEVLHACMTALAGVIFLSAGLHGFFTARLGILARLLFVSAAFTLIAQGGYSDLLGASLAAAGYLLQRFWPAAQPRHDDDGAQLPPVPQAAETPLNSRGRT